MGFARRAYYKSKFLSGRKSSHGQYDNTMDSEACHHLAGGKLQRAQQVAAACRAACDVLKGAPKSSRDDPFFMDNYYKSSRLHFIGTWKARIEALAAKTAGTTLLLSR